MDSRRGPQPDQAPTPEPLDVYWLVSLLPDVLCVPPPDAIVARAQDEHPMDTLLIDSITIVTGLLILIIILMTAVA